MRLIVFVIVVAMAAPARADVVNPRFDELEAGATAGETYRLNALGIASEGVSPALPTLFGGRSAWWRPVRGAYRRGVPYQDFFRVLGRSDLAEQHRQARLVAGIFYWGGAALFVGGAAVLLTGLRDPGFSTRKKVGVGLMIGGVWENGVGGVIQPPLVSEKDAATLVTEYNRRLRVHLGLAADHAVVLTLRGPW